MYSRCGRFVNSRANDRLSRTCASLGQSVAVGCDLGWISILFTDHHIERAADDRHGVLTHVDLMKAVLTWDKPHRAVTCTVHSFILSFVFIRSKHFDITHT